MIVYRILARPPACDRMASHPPLRPQGACELAGVEEGGSGGGRESVKGGCCEGWVRGKLAGVEEGGSGGGRESVKGERGKTPWPRPQDAAGLTRQIPDALPTIIVREGADRRACRRPSDARATRDGCRASAGRLPGERRPNLLQRCPAPARATRRTNWGAPAGVQSLRMCRRRFEHVWAHSQGGHPREWRGGEARHSHRAGRRDARRWPKSTEDDERPTPPQGGEPERRRDERRTRRQAGGTENLPRRRRGFQIHQNP
jgi:hypothetical protein